MTHPSSPPPSADTGHTQAGTGPANRRQRYSAVTKRALVDVAEVQFTEHGYVNTSLDAIVAGAQVTKGALYHHFSGKQAIFEAAFARVEARAAASIDAATEGHTDPWLAAQAGLRAFLDVVQEPGYRRLVIADGPSVLGHDRFREQGGRSTYAIVLKIVRDVLSVGPSDLDDAMLDTYTRIFFGAMSAAGGAVAISEDPAAAAARVETAIGFILAGMRSLVEEGTDLPDPSSEERPTSRR